MESNENDQRPKAKKWGWMRGENIFGVKIVNAGTCVVKIVNTGSCGVKVNILRESARKTLLGATRFEFRCARERLAEKSGKFRYLRRKSLHTRANDQKPNAKYQRRVGKDLSKSLGAGSGERARNLKVAATPRDGSDCGRRIVGHIFLFSYA